MISPKADVNPNAKIGKGTIVSSFCYIEEDVEIDENCWIGPNVSILNGARIGKNCKIFPGAVISAIPQDLKYKGENTTTIIGNNTTIRECVTINKGTADKNTTMVGNNCLLMAYVHVAHDCIIGNNVIMANLVTLAGHIKIEDFAILEGLVAVQQFVTIGQHSFITGASLVRKNVPPYVKAAREPLAYAGINSVGLKRRGFSEQLITEIEETYRIIYIKNSTIKAGIEALKAQNPTNTQLQIISFIESSEKGVIRSPLDKTIA